MPTAGPAMWLVCKHAKPFKFVARHVVSHRLKRACVESACHAIAAIRAAVEHSAKVHRCDRAVPFNSCFHPHRDRVATAVAIKDFFARESDLHRSPRNHRKFRDSYLVIERIALTAKTAAVWCCNHSNVTCGKLQDFGKRAMNIMRRLR